MKDAPILLQYKFPSILSETIINCCQPKVFVVDKHYSIVKSWEFQFVLFRFCPCNIWYKITTRPGFHGHTVRLASQMTHLSDLSSLHHVLVHIQSKDDNGTLDLTSNSLFRSQILWTGKIPYLDHHLENVLAIYRLENCFDRFWHL